MSRNEGKIDAAGHEHEAQGEQREKNDGAGFLVETVEERGVGGVAEDEGQAGGEDERGQEGGCAGGKEPKGRRARRD